MKKTLTAMAVASMLVCSSVSAGPNPFSQLKEKVSKDKSDGKAEKGKDDKKAPAKAAPAKSGDKAPAKATAAKTGDKAPAKDGEKAAAKPEKKKYDEKAYRKAVEKKKYDEALELLAAVSKPSVAQLLDKGMILHMQGKYTEAAAAMEAATKQMDGLMPNPKKGAENINASGDYPGSIYEYLLVDALNSLNYYKLAQNAKSPAEKDKKIGDAYSRLVRAGDKQREYMKYYGEAEKNEVVAEIAQKGGNMDEETKFRLEKLGFDGIADFVSRVNKLELPRKVGKEEVDGLLYKTSAFADYLQVVLAAQNGSNVDDFIVKELKKMAAGPVEVAYENLGKKGRIEVVSLTDTVLVREAKNNYVPADTLLENAFALVPGVDASYMFWMLMNRPVIKNDDIEMVPEAIENRIRYNFAWPVIKQRAEPAVAVESVTLSNGASKKAILLEDFDQAVKNDVDLKARRIARKTISISVSTQTPTFVPQLIMFSKSIDMANNAYSKACSMADKIHAPRAVYEKALEVKLRAIQKAKETIVGNIGKAAPRAADCQSIAIPSKAYATGFTVEPGVYTVTVKYTNGKKEVIEGVEVKAGRPVLVPSHSGAAK